jgi:antitoxin HicB
VRFEYPFEVDSDGDSVVISFPDVPGALTQVDPGEDLQAMARDCLLAALGGYIEHRLPVPTASPPRGRGAITLDVMASAKLALASAMAEAGVSNVALARRLGVDEKVVRRLLNLDHSSRIGRLEEALAVLDKSLQVTMRPRVSMAKGVEAKRQGRP